VVVAVAAACGLYTILRYRDVQLATSAALSFDTAEAQLLDSHIMQSPHPAVVLGQSILGDSVVAKLVPKADPSASSTPIAVGEFRSRLELTQPLAGLLLVRYRDSDPGQAVAIANEVAESLAEWTPSPTSTPPPAANSQTAPAPAQTAPAPAQPVPAPAQPAPDPASKPPLASGDAPETHSAGPSLAAALAELEAQLSSADHRISQEQSSQSGHDRQRFLESQVRDVQQKLRDLRSKFARPGSANHAQARLDTIQHALAAFWPSAAGLNTAGTSEAQLRYERQQLNRDIGIVEKQRQAAQSEEASNSASVNPPAPEAAPADPSSQPVSGASAGPSASQTAPAAPESQPAPAPDALSSPAADIGVNLFHLQRAAAMPAPMVWWPSAFVGCLCGLLYWGLVFASYRFRRNPDEMLDFDDEGALYAYRRFVNDLPGENVSPSSEAIRASNAGSSRNGQPEAGVDRTRTPMAQTASAVSATASAVSVTASAANDVAPQRASEEVSHEKAAEKADPWGDEIRKNLSETTIGRTLDREIATEESAAPKGPARDDSPPPSETSRRAG
jgi:hypothetical protein